MVGVGWIGCPWNARSGWRWSASLAGFGPGGRGPGLSAAGFGAFSDPLSDVSLKEVGIGADPHERHRQLSAHLALASPRTAVTWARNLACQSAAWSPAYSLRTSVVAHTSAVTKPGRTPRRAAPMAALREPVAEDSRLRGSAHGRRP